MGRALEIRDDVGAHELRGWARKAAADHPDKTIELRFQDEARVGSKGRLGHRWWIKAYRAPGLSDKRFQWAYVFAAVRPRSTGYRCFLFTRGRTGNIYKGVTRAIGSTHRQSDRRRNDRRRSRAIRAFPPCSDSGREDSAYGTYTNLH